MQVVSERAVWLTAFVAAAAVAAASRLGRGTLSRSCSQHDAHQSLDSFYLGKPSAAANLHPH
jgi:hypothetical protein